MGAGDFMNAICLKRDGGDLTVSVIILPPYSDEKSLCVYENFTDNLKTHLADSLGKKGFCERVSAWDAACKLLKNSGVESDGIFFENGKPLTETVSLSISHTQGLVAAVTGDIPVGVDVQTIKKVEYKKIADRMGFKNVATEDEFFKEWTKYEAEFKIGKNVEVETTVKKIEYCGNEYFFALAVKKGFVGKIIYDVPPQMRIKDFTK